MKKLLFITTITLSLFIAQSVFAQSNYINHTLKQGETLSALANQYNTNVGDIMRMNGMHADTKLVYGSVIKIPSNKKNIVETQVTQPSTETIVAAPANALTHTVAKGETLYSISKQYNISAEQIKAWNHLADDNVKMGSNLIVGTNNNVAEEASKPAEELQNQSVQTAEQNKEIPSIEPEQKNEVTNNNTSSETVDENVDVTSNQIAGNVADNVQSPSAITATGEGYFADLFSKKNKHKKKISGISKTFKTASGWSDGKYYILADDINPGTIVKLTAENGNSVYAKVLWNMGDLKENNGVNFRVSNATAAALNENTSSFNLNVTY